jgi:hypothetical protein
MRRSAILAAVVSAAWGEVSLTVSQVQGKIDPRDRFLTSVSSVKKIK